MNTACSNCDADVPEGSQSCPVCGAGLGTLLFGKKKGLTRTLIGMALELRKSIPWASESSVRSLDDPPMRLRKPVLFGGAVALIAATVGGFVLFHHDEGKAGAAVSEIASKAADHVENTAAAVQTSVQKAEKVAEKAAEKVAEKVPVAASTVVASAPSRPSKAPAASTTHSASAKAAKKAGTLVVNATYKGKQLKDARVMVNGERKGATPLTVALAPGKYTIKVEKAGYRTEKRTDVKVVSGKKAAMKVELKK